MQLIPLFLLPFYQPILLAEQIAMLDVMSGGRTTMICCLGHQPEAHEAFQTPQKVRVSRFVETFEIVRRLCTEDNVSYHQYLRQLRKAEGGLSGMNTAQAGDLLENLSQ
jgi:alkanesulfonate monooxygenase SsuD/methylene tetrahydromethanopterin reductase-like flavin-dependent oxidoreductase (luciferase family)